MKRQTLYFRLTSPAGGALSARAGHPITNDGLWDQTDDLVRQACRKLHPDLNPVDGLIPEIWSQDTVDRFEEMEEMIETLASLMDQADLPPNVDPVAWGAAIDEAYTALGWTIPDDILAAHKPND